GLARRAGGRRSSHEEHGSAEHERRDLEHLETRGAHDLGELLRRRERGDRLLQVAVLALARQRAAYARDDASHVQARERAYGAFPRLGQLEDRDPAAGPRDARHLAQRRGPIRDVADPERDGDGVDAAVAEVEGLSVAAAQLDARAEAGLA